MNRLVGMILCLGVALSALGDLRLYVSDWDRWGPLGPEDAVPPFDAPGVDNPGLSSDSLQGRVTVLTFWASWCGPCGQEMPTIQKIADSYASDAVRVVGVNRDREGDVLQIVRAYRAERGLSFDMVLDAGNMGRAFRVTMIPHLVIVDAQGAIRFVHQGRVSEATLRAEIDQLLAESSAIRPDADGSS